MTEDITNANRVLMLKYNSISGEWEPYEGGGGGSSEADNTIISGELDVTSAGTPEPLSATTIPIRKLYLKAKRKNTGYVAIGDSGVDAAEATEQGYSLESEDPIVLEFADLKDIYADVTVDGEGVSWFATLLSP